MSEVDVILARLADPATQADRLLEECRQPPLELWKQHPELYRKFSQKLIQQGHPGRALELAREGAEHLRDDTRLQYSLALAAARGGNPQYARSILKPLLVLAEKPDGERPADMSTQLRVEIVSLQGRIFKDQSRGQPELARRSAEWYEKAANLPGVRELPDGGTFPLINAATMWRVAGDETKSRMLAEETLQRVSARDAATDDPVWRPATLGEANLLLGRHEASIPFYLEAVQAARGSNRVGDLIAMRHNIQFLLKAGVTADPKFLDEHIGSVVVFTGHMIDSPDRMANPNAVTRFPNDPKLIEEAKKAIAAKLAEINAKVGYSSLACGADILFAEAMLERGAELHVLLPFSQHDFLRTSVNFGQTSDDWLKWQTRFLNVWMQVPSDRRRFTTTEPYLGTQGLYTWAGEVIQGIAVMRSHERGGRPQAVCLIDRSQSGQLGGAADFISTWQAAGHPFHEIDLGKLRAEHAPNAVSKKVAMAPPPATSTLPRSMKAMVFADVAGFSGIPEWMLADFLAEYGDYLRCVFQSPVGKVASYANTWGDGLYVVFDKVADAAAFAMELVQPTVAPHPNWAKYELGETVPFRVGLHTGPVYELPNLFQGWSGYSGQHVNRAARIEPITIRGCAYGSEPFAAVLTVQASDRFRVEAVGQHSLAKGYDRCTLYRVDRVT